MVSGGGAGGAGSAQGLLEPPPRLVGVASLLLLILYGGALLAEALSRGVPFAVVDPWPLGGGEAGVLSRGLALTLGLSLGWCVPGLSLALLADPGRRGPVLLGRALGLGLGYLLVTGLAHAVLVGHAPGRTALLVLLAIPPVLILFRPEGDAKAGLSAVLVAAALMAILTAVLWEKLAREGMNGDGTEAYELARSLGAHALPRWDVERPEGPGRFGTPAVNPFLTNSYLGAAGMAILGRGELAVRLPLVPGLVIAAFLAGAGARGASARAYVAAVAAVYLLWNAYYVGYEPAFADLAEPAATDTLMTAVWLAGFGEVVTGSVPLGVVFLLLASGVLYSAPILATLALAFLRGRREERARRALRLWIGAAAILSLAALVLGAARGDLADWVRQVRSEYWYDLVDQRRRSPTLPVLGQALLMTGGLPLLASRRLGRLSTGARAQLGAGLVYLAVVVVSSYKNLHYLAPLPFLLAGPALEASRPILRAAATAGLAGVFALSWPSPRGIHREAAELGDLSCVEGLGYEDASLLAGDAIYGAFRRPGEAGRLAVSKHSFVRYALERGGSGCAFRLSPTDREGWIPVAGGPVTLSVRDVDLYVRWRFSTPPVPCSWLFVRSQPQLLSPDARAWTTRMTLSAAPGSALLLDGLARYESRDVGNPGEYVGLSAPRARLLVPSIGDRIRLRTWAPEGGLALRVQVNANPAPDLSAPPGWAEVGLPTDGPPWRRGWSILELSSPAGAASPLAIDWIQPEGARR